MCIIGIIPGRPFKRVGRTLINTSTTPNAALRSCDFNVHSEDKTAEKLKYIHRNPVVRGLVTRPEDWAWSSFRNSATGERRRVQIESFWTAWERDNETLTSLQTGPPASTNPESNPGDPGHPGIQVRERMLDLGHPPANKEQLCHF